MELNNSLFSKSLKPITERSKSNSTQLSQAITLQALTNLQTLLKTKKTMLNKVKHIKIKNKQIINSLHFTDLKEKLQCNLQNIHRSDTPQASSTLSSNRYLCKSNSQYNLPTVLSLEIGSLFKVNYHNVKDFTHLHGSLSRLREIVKEKEAYSLQKEFELKSKKTSMDDSLVKLQAEYDLLEANLLSLEDYIIFLKKTFASGRQLSEQYDNKKNELKADIRSTFIKIDKLKGIREVLLGYRNYFICVKEHRTTLPAEFTQPFHFTFTRDEKKKNTVTYNGAKQRKREVIKRRKSRDDNDTKENNQTSEIMLNDNSMEIYLNHKVPIFSSTEAFIQKLTYYDNQNLKLACEYNYSVNELERYKSQLMSLEGEHKALKEKNGKMKKMLSKRLCDLKEDNSSLKLALSHLRKSIECKRTKRDIEKYMALNTGITHETNLPLVRFSNYCTDLGFMKDLSYVFYYVSNIMKGLYREKASFLRTNSEVKFKEDQFKQVLSHLGTPDDWDQGLLREECLYCFKLLEYVINRIVIKHQHYKDNLSLIGRLEEVEEQRRRTRTLLNSQEHRFLQDKKRKESIKELWLKSNRTLYRSHSGLFFNSKNKVNINKEVIETSNSLKLAKALFHVSEQTTIL